MPSFRFRGFAEASAVALIVAQGAQVIGASAAWGQPAGAGGQPGGVGGAPGIVGTPSGSFTIERIGGLDDPIAPFGAVFRTQNIAGFSVSEPPPGSTEEERNVYDPTQHKITWVWNFGDTAYTPITASLNLPDAWRDSNIAYGRQVAHCYHNGGTYTVTCFAFDEEGNWGTAELEVGPIAARDAAFAGASSVYLSFQGEFTAVPAGVAPSNRCTSLSAAMSRMQTIANGGNKPRLLYRYGEDYINHPRIASLPSQISSTGFQVGAYGNPEDGRPILRPDATAILAETGNSRNFISLNSGMAATFEDIDFRGPWDSTTETGRCVVFNRIFYSSNFLMHRCRVDGFEVITLGTEGGSSGDHMLSDCDITNNRKFMAYANATTNAISRLSAINCDFHNHAEALSGVNNGGGNPDGINMGNQHGVRFAGFYEMYLGCCSFFTRVGWSLSNPTAGTAFPPTTLQPALRLSFVSTMNNFRFFNCIDRCTFEGGDDMLRFTPVNVAEDFNWNMVIDKALLVGCVQTSSFINSNFSGITCRNGLFVRNSGVYQKNGSVFSGNLIRFGDDQVVEGATAPVEFYNNTVMILASSSDLGGASPGGAFSADEDLELSAENNVFFAPNTDTTLGTEFVPLGTSPIEGFTPRYLGTRWNFPPVGVDGGPQSDVTVGSARADEAGASGDVADGEWVRLPWPDYTGRCNGAGMADVRAAVLSNSTQRHEVSIDAEPEVMWRGGDSALSSDMDGRVTFDFSNPGYFRIRNNSGVTWAANRRIVVKFDLSDRLMDFKPGTATPAVVPLPMPGAGSAALVETKLGLWARDDFFGTIRTAPTAMGAFHPAS